MTLTPPIRLTPFRCRLWRQIEEALPGRLPGGAAFGVGGVVFGRQVTATREGCRARRHPLTTCPVSVGQDRGVSVRPRRRGRREPPTPKAEQVAEFAGCRGPCAYSPNSRTVPGGSSRRRNRGRIARGSRGPLRLGRGDGGRLSSASARFCAANGCRQIGDLCRLQCEQLVAQPARPAGPRRPPGFSRMSASHLEVRAPSILPHDPGLHAQRVLEARDGGVSHRSRAPAIIASKSPWAAAVP